MKWGVGIALLVLVLGSAGVAWYVTTHHEHPVVYDGVHYASHTGAEFYGDIAASSTPHIAGIKGAIVSHHLLVADKIAELFASIGSKEIKTVVIVGPDHFRRGAGALAVSRYPFETPWGQVEPNLSVIDDLIAKGLVEDDEYVFEIEHSIGSLVPYVKYHFPNAKLVPIVLQRNVRPEDSEALGRYLAEHLPDDAIVIASVDFSHHQGVTQAAFHDAKSVETIRAFDFESLPRLEVDSPASLTVLLHYLDRIGAKRPVSFESTNSAEFLGLPDSEDVTSYLFATFAKGAPEGPGVISILAVGDTMLGRAVGKELAEGIDLFALFRGIEGNFLRGFDMFIANLEGPITTTSNCQKKEIVFSFDPSVAEILKQEGVTHVNLANNHSFDCLSEGLSDTKQYLDAAGIRYVGGGTLAESTKTEVINGKRIALLGLDRTIAPLNSQTVYDYVRTLKQTHDYVLAEVHWGIEYEPLESPLQKEFAHGLIDNGVDVVIGHHPHVVEPIEVYNGKLIFYSLGNFIFDQRGVETNTGIAAGLILKEDTIQTYIYPFTINEKHQPALMPFAKAQAYCASLPTNAIRDPHNACIMR